MRMKIYGPPGTGKTTRLIGIVEQLISQGIKPERIAFVSFTQKAVREAKERAMAHFSLPAESFPNFRTIHSLAFQYGGCEIGDIMHDDHYQTLAYELGFRFTNLSNELFVPAGSHLGDKVARIESIARLQNKSYRELWEELAIPGCPWEAVEQWVAGINRYKQQKGIWDYTDLLEHFDHTIDVDAAILDEAQDLSPLQWKMFWRAFSDCENIFIAGDDDQSIYCWAGARPDEFVNALPNDPCSILDQSYRIPRRIRDHAADVIQRIETRVRKKWRPRDEDGEVHKVPTPAHCNISNGNWLLLARNQYHLERWRDMCIEKGYMWKEHNNRCIKPKASKAIKAWEDLREGKDISNRSLKALSRYHPHIKEMQVSTVNKRMMPDVVFNKPWFTALELMPQHEISYIMRCIDNGYDIHADMSALPIQISTIHAAKGGEADNVAILGDITKQTWERAEGSEECRVLYVAITRARKALFYVESSGKYSHNFPRL